MGNKIVYEKVNIDELDNTKFKKLAVLFNEVFPNIINPEDTQQNIKKCMHGEYDKDTWLLAIKNPDIIGMVTVSDIDDKHMYIYNFGVKKEFRRQGIGNTLFKTVVNDAKKRVVFSVDIHNPELIQMYRRWGATKYGSDEKYVNMRIN